MTRLLLRSALLCVALVQALPSAVAADRFSFGVISHPFRQSSDEAALRSTIEETDAENLAFVVINGMKAANEPCTDQLYKQRKALLESAKNGLILSLAADDWAECRTRIGKSDAIGKLNQLRDLYFADGFSLGGSRIPVSRQSTIAKFRGFAENARWEMGEIMFATVNLPGDNNHYLPDAGRNSEFEDRLVANRDWLNRVFTFAQRGKLDAVVLFCDANPLASSETTGSRRDGFAETRKQIFALASKFSGKVLIVHGQGGREAVERRINWHGNIGELEATPGWVKVVVNPSAQAIFTVEAFPPQATNHNR